MNTSTAPLPAILWGRVFGLAAVQGSISLTWLIYNLYLPDLLTQMGLPKTLAAGILVVENALAVLMEPLMGSLSDRALHRVGSRMPFIALGVILSASLFIILPVLVILGGQPTVLTQNLFLACLVAWALAMTIFRSPALCLLGKYAMSTQLAQAFSLVTLVGSLVGALRPILTPIFLSWGPAVVFTLGSCSLLGGAATLRAVDPPVPAPATRQSAETILPPANKLLSSSMAYLIILGASIAWALRFMLGELLPRLIKTGWPNINIIWPMALISLVMGVAAIPAGLLASRWNNQRLMGLALGLAATLVMLLSWLPVSQITIAIIFLLVICTSAATNSAVPLAITLLPPDRGGLGVGIYFGGFSGTMAIAGWLIPTPSTLSGANLTVMVTTALIVAGSCVLLSPPRT